MDICIIIIFRLLINWLWELLTIDLFKLIIVNRMIELYLLTIIF